jgi:hypothetical protein
VNRRQFIKGAGGLFVPAAPALLLPKQAKAAQWLPLFKQASGGGGPSLAYPIPSGLSQQAPGNAGPYTFTAVDIGTGSQFVIMAIFVQGNNNGNITDLALNSTALTNVVTDSSNTLSLFAGTVTGLTGSDTITLTMSASVAFEDIDIAVWTATGLTSTTALQKGSTPGGTTITLPASPGNLLFACISGTSAFSSPTGITARATITGPDSSSLSPADATLTSGQISGGDVTVTSVVDVAVVAAIFN